MSDIDFYICHTKALGESESEQCAREQESESEEFARELYQLLSKQGYTVFLDVIDLPVGTVDECVNVVKDAKVLLVILDDHFPSQWCLEEIKAALSSGRFIQCIYNEFKFDWDQVGKPAWWAKGLPYEVIAGIFAQPAISYHRHHLYEDGAIRHTLEVLYELVPGKRAEDLVKMLDKGPPNAKEKAAGTIRDLAVQAGEVQVKLVQLGAVPLLVDMLEDGDNFWNSSAKRKAAGALWNLAAHVENKSILMEYGIGPKLVMMLEGGPAEAKEWAAGAVASLAVQNENKAKLLQLGAEPKLAKLVDEEGTAKEHAFIALQRLREASDAGINAEGVYQEDAANTAREMAALVAATVCSAASCTKINGVAIPHDIVTRWIAVAIKELVGGESGKMGELLDTISGEQIGALDPLERRIHQAADKVAEIAAIISDWAKPSTVISGATIPREHLRRWIEVSILECVQGQAGKIGEFYDHLNDAAIGALEPFELKVKNAGDKELAMAEVISAWGLPGTACCSSCGNVFAEDTIFCRRCGQIRESAT
eukprot:TRINITY_DN89073_c0_g1_i1.p1 TRINITY_DN89073_c0_g1~~TRINITY_DN89073_c0_g1_i1.p1  ORF type:complete len:538 (-),score=123.65 TRINITY_DN89073_c0_g1_i1:108-1721(-)